MGYVRTAGKSTAARRARRRAILIITALLLALVLALGVSVAYVQGWLGQGAGGGADDAAQTTAAPTPELTPDQVVVNVFNATDRTGLAGRASEGLQVRGFRVEDVDNAEAVEGTGVIRHGPEGLQAAQLLQESLPQELALELDEARDGADLDLVLGPDWEDLPTPEDPTEES